MPITKNLSTLTTIPEKHLNKLLDKVYLCINDAVAETVLEEKQICDIDIGIGTLIINFNDNMLKYKFIPNEKLDKSIKSTIVHKQNNLTRVIEDTLVNKIINVYKDLL